MNTSHSTEQEGATSVVERVVGEELYDALFVRSNRVAILLEPDGRVVDINDAALALGEFDRAGVVGGTLWELPLFSGEKAQAVRADIRYAAAEKRVDVDWEIQSESGAAVLNVEIQPITPGNGVAFLLVIGVDVTDREQRITALERQTERLEEFVRIVSHDLRTPLSVASARLDLATEQADLAELDRVERSLDRIDELLTDAQSVASTGYTVEDRTTVDLETLARSAWDHVETGDATLDIESTTNLSADETRLTQVFENLFVNSMEHGSTSPASRAPEEAHAGITVRVGACEGGFYVADDGTGLPENAFGSVFEAGVTTTSDGTGFGLSIVESIVLAHGWTIEAGESADGGARFDVRTDPDDPDDSPDPA